MNSKGRQIMNNDIEKVLFDQTQLDKRMDEMADELNQKYADKQPIVIPVLNGAGTESTGKVKITQDIKSDVKDQPVIFMEDIIDTGRTLQALSEVMKDRGAASVEVVAMLDKPTTRVVDFHADYYGFQAPDAFLVGYGLDYNGLYRNLPYVGILKRKIYA